jgi:hypothetical protein
MANLRKSRETPRKVPALSKRDRLEKIIGGLSSGFEFNSSSISKILEASRALQAYGYLKHMDDLEWMSTGREI